MEISRIKIQPSPWRTAASTAWTAYVMSGDVRSLMDEGKPAALLIAECDRPSFCVEVPLEEWRLESEIRPWGTSTMTLLVPPDCNTTNACIINYRPAPERDRSGLSRNDWNNVEPSLNPGLLAYYINDTLTVVTLPMMSKEGVRHNWYRHFFLEFNDAPDWLHPLSYHNNPGISIEKERQMVAELRRTISHG